MGLEFFLTNLSHEIQQECKRNDIVCHSNFIRYYLNLLALDPLWNLHAKMKLIVREDAQRLINFVVKKMRYEKCPCIVALRMQYYFSCRFEPLKVVATNTAANLKKHLQPLIDEIIAAEPHDILDYDKLVKQIIYYCVLYCDLGNPTVELVYREAYMALHSILENDADLDAFVKLSGAEKYERLDELAMVCGGIRIFNWSQKKSGQGIDNVMTSTPTLIDNCAADLERRFQGNMYKLDILTSVIDYTFALEARETYKDGKLCMEYAQVCVRMDGIDSEESEYYKEIEYYKDLIIVFRMVEFFYRSIQKVIDELYWRDDQIRNRYVDCSERIQSTAGLKSGVPTSVIFPLFVELQCIWSNFQMENTYVRGLMDIVNDIETYVRDLTLNYDRLEDILRGRDILSDEDRHCEQVLCTADSLHNSMLNISAKSMSELTTEKMVLEFGGFDVWRMIESQGGLVPGNPNLGLVTFNGLHYVFTGRESRQMFVANPQHYINEALALARRKPELIPLLQLEEKLREIQSIKTLVVETIKKAVDVKKVHTTQQTELHPIAQRVQNNYHASVWDLKKMALQMADLTTKRTKATITTHNNSQRPVGTQTCMQRNCAVQTRKDAQSNTNRPVNYIFGLRGRRDNKQVVIDLTQPIKKTI